MGMLFKLRRCEEREEGEDVKKTLNSEQVID